MIPHGSIQVENFDEHWRLPPAKTVTFMWGKLHVGEYDQTTKTYFIERVPAQHFYVKKRSYGVSLKVLNILKNNRCFAVHLTEHGKTGVKMFGARLDLFFNSGEPVLNTIAPFETQLHVPLSLWTSLSGRWKPDDIRTPTGQDVIREAYPSEK